MRLCVCILDQLSGMLNACALLYCHLYPVRTYNILPHCLIIGANFTKREGERERERENLLNIKCVWSDFDRASSLLCGNKMPTRCNRWYLLQNLLQAQHVSGNTMPIIRSNKICNKYHLLHLVGILFPHKMRVLIFF